MDLANYHIRVKMPLTRKNQNVVGGAFWKKLVFHGRSIFYAFTDASSRIKIYRLGQIGLMLIFYLLDAVPSMLIFA